MTDLYAHASQIWSLHCRPDRLTSVYLPAVIFAGATFLCVRGLHNLCVLTSPSLSELPVDGIS